MNEKLRTIINHYGINKQLKYFQSEIFELNEAIIYERATSKYGDERNDYKCIKHITEEIADVTVMLKQIQLYYNISTSDIREVMNYKIDRQLNRINEEESKNDK